MTCSDFLDRYSDFRDGELPPEVEEHLHGHLEVCASCRRYDRALSVGMRILRESERLLPREEMRDRIRFGVYREERDENRRNTVLPGRGITIGFGVAATIAAVMAVALLREGQPGEPSAAVASLAAEVGGSQGAGSLFRTDRGDLPAFEPIEFRTGSNILLYENSPLFRRHRQPQILMAERR